MGFTFNGAGEILGHPGPCLAMCKKRLRVAVKLPSPRITRCHPRSLGATGWNPSCINLAAAPAARFVRLFGRVSGRSLFLLLSDAQSVGSHLLKGKSVPGRLFLGLYCLSALSWSRRSCRGFGFVPLFSRATQCLLSLKNTSPGGPC